MTACEKHGLETVFIVAPTTPDSRLDIITKATTGFIYYVSREGVTGEQASMSQGIGARVQAIKAHTDLPVVVGFGISNSDHVRQIAALADGVVVGSTLVNCIAHNQGDADAIVGALKDKMAALTEGQALYR